MGTLLERQNKGYQRSDCTDTAMNLIHNLCNELVDSRKMHIYLPYTLLATTTIIKTARFIYKSLVNKFGK